MNFITLSVIITKEDFDSDVSFSMTWRDYASYTLMIWKFQQQRVILELNSQVLSHVKLILPTVA